MSAKWAPSIVSSNFTWTSDIVNYISHRAKKHFERSMKVVENVHTKYFVK